MIVKEHQTILSIFLNNITSVMLKDKNKTQQLENNYIVTMQNSHNPTAFFFFRHTVHSQRQQRITLSIFRRSAHEIQNHLSRIQNNGTPPYGFICVHLSQQAAYSYHSYISSFIRT